MIYTHERSSSSALLLSVQLGSYRTGTRSFHFFPQKLLQCLLQVSLVLANFVHTCNARPLSEGFLMSDGSVNSSVRFTDGQNCGDGECTWSSFRGGEVQLGQALSWTLDSSQHSNAILVSRVVCLEETFEGLVWFHVLTNLLCEGLQEHA